MSIGNVIEAFFTAAGPGGMVVMTVIGLAATVYFLLTRWILRGGEQDAEEERHRFK
jgi:F0F1-type ATP synthase assembly protein I